MNKFLTLCSVLLLGVVGCEKDGGNEPEQARKVKSITVYDEAGKAQGAVHVQYDADSRIAEVKQYDDATLTDLYATTKYDYTKLAEKKISSTRTREATSGSTTKSELRYAATLDAEGRVTEIVTTDPARPNYLSAETIAYDANGYLSKSSNGRSNKVAFSWADGNLSESKGTFYTEYITAGQVVGSINIDLNWFLYGSENLVFAMGGEGLGSFLMAQGFCGKRNTKLFQKLVDRASGTPAGDSSESTKEMTYTLDDKGCPTEVKVKVATVYNGEVRNRRYVIAYE